MSAETRSSERRLCQSCKVAWAVAAGLAGLVLFLSFYVLPHQINAAVAEAQTRNQELAARVETLTGYMDRARGHLAFADKPYKQAAKKHLRETATGFMGRRPLSRLSA